MSYPSPGDFPESAPWPTALLAVSMLLLGAAMLGGLVALGYMLYVVTRGLTWRWFLGLG